MPTRRPLVLLVSLSALMLSACGSPADRAAEAQASIFRTALSSADGEAACAVLSPRTREELARSTGEPCAEAVLAEQVPTQGEPREVRVYGNMAQVRYDGETMFLSRFDAGWLVSAAGCTEPPSGIYDCAIQGS